MSLRALSADRHDGRDDDRYVERDDDRDRPTTERTTDAVTDPATGLVTGYRYPSRTLSMPGPGPLAEGSLGPQFDSCTSATSD